MNASEYEKKNALFFFRSKHTFFLYEQLHVVGISVELIGAPEIF